VCRNLGYAACYQAHAGAILASRLSQSLLKNDMPSALPDLTTFFKFLGYAAYAVGCSYLEDHASEQLDYITVTPMPHSSLNTEL